MRFHVAFCWIVAATAHADEALLADLATRFASEPRTAGTFVQTAHVAVLTEPVVSRGRFYVDPELGISWHVDEPIVAHFLLKEQGATHTDAAQGMPLAFVGRVMNALLTARFDGLTSQFDVKASRNGADWHLALTPKSPVARRFVVAIEVSGADDISTVVIVQPAGDAIEIAFDDVTHPDTLPDEIVGALEESR